MNQLKHIAVIMDGNGRWAKKRGLPRREGHLKGRETFLKLCNWIAMRQIEYLTIFAFSTENWKRPKEEINAIMLILENYFQTAKETAIKNQYRITVIGNRENLSSALCSYIADIEEATKDNTGLKIQIAVNYGGRDEIVRAVNLLLCNKNRESVPVNEAEIEQFLDTAGIPFPDLLIRTGGEVRLSNFMAWQLAYTELYFSETLWPDFDEAELDRAICYYEGKCRKFGNVDC